MFCAWRVAAALRSPLTDNAPTPAAALAWLVAAIKVLAGSELADAGAAANTRAGAMPTTVTTAPVTAPIVASSLLARRRGGRAGAGAAGAVKSTSW